MHKIGCNTMSSVLQQLYAQAQQLCEDGCDPICIVIVMLGLWWIIKNKMTELNLQRGVAVFQTNVTVEKRRAF